MRRITSMAIPGLALLSLFMAVPNVWGARAQLAHNGANAPSTAPAQRWTICIVQGVSTNTDRGIRTTMYVSGTMHTVPPQNYQDVDRAFGQFITSKFLPAGMSANGATCWSGTTPAEAERAIIQPGTTPAPGQAIRLDCTRGNTQCVMTRWTAMPATPAAETSAQPSAAAARPVDPCAISGVGMETHPPPGCGPVITSYTVCSSASNQSPVYISGAFAVTKMDNPAWVNGFTRFLGQKYSYQGDGVGCNNMSLNDAPTFLKNRIAALRANEKQVVETGWAYGSAAALPAASAAAVAPAPVAPAPVAPSPATPARPAAPASSVPQTHYGICYGSPAGLPPTAYFSDPFEAPVPNVQAWSNTYRQVLRNQYKFMPNVHCSALKSLAEVQKMKDKMRVHWKIVETGWNTSNGGRPWNPDGR
jgi:hypothetical protein